MAVKTTLVKIYTDQPNLRIKYKLKQAETVQFRVQNICSIVFLVNCSTSLQQQMTEKKPRKKPNNL